MLQELCGQDTLWQQPQVCTYRFCTAVGDSKPLPIPPTLPKLLHDIPNSSYRLQQDWNLVSPTQYAQNHCIKPQTNNLLQLSKKCKISYIHSFDAFSKVSFKGKKLLPSFCETPDFRSCSHKNFLLWCIKSSSQLQSGDLLSWQCLEHWLSREKHFSLSQYQTYGNLFNIKDKEFLYSFWQN